MCNLPCFMLGVVDVVHVLVSVNCRLVEVDIIMFVFASLSCLLLRCHVSCLHLTFYLGFIRFRLVLMNLSCCLLPVRTCCAHMMYYPSFFAVFCIRKFSQQFIIFPFGHVLNIFTVVLIGSYSC